MNADRWRQIENAFHGALLCQPSEREARVLELCGDDQNLFREVITLISYYEKPDDFLERPQLSVGLNILATQDSDLEEGETIGPYIVEKRIGRGGMGDVYLARDERLGRQIALKLLPKSFEDHQDWVGRFQHEARAASSISHPNVAHIYEVGEFRGRHYIAMEYIDGETLRMHLRNRGPLPVAEAVDIVTQVARALTAAHSAGVLHRDIKPDNVMLHRDGYVKVLDFGLAKSTGPFKSQTSGGVLSSVVTTEAGIIVGSPAYMSPEQARGFDLDYRSDLWSLGVVFYELLTLKNPFASETTSDT
ncbi:MAG TPA: serine/threonine-protein kinase, partial [Pyrinomonadaceae bacterium]|nr:serine/threonine-protein kinase [Pyrinomonadaceae bacterium]